MKPKQPTGAPVGYIYLAVNPSLEETVKIGASVHNPLDRMAQLSASTSIPTSFTLAYSRRVNQPFAVEAALHREFDAYRTSDSREFFRVPLHKIISALEMYEERGEMNPYPFATLFASFNQDGPAELTADEQRQCLALQNKLYL